MAEISASQVKELREMTGLGMMECKKALVEAGGDVKKAEEILRIKSGAKASKAAARVTAEGVIGGYVSPDAKVAAMVELNCETDFVAKNEDFLAFAKALAEKVATGNPADIEALSQAGFEGGTVEQKRQALIQKIGENISIRRIHRVKSDQKIAQYLHGSRIGVTVEYEGPEEVGKDVAMHIAFAKPQALTRDEVDPEVVAREREILSARAAESGKPADIVARMVEGGVNKFIGEITLLGQPFVRNDKETVEKMLKSRGATVRSFRFFVVGEGLEKRSSDFAAEVAAAAASGR